MAKIRYVVLEKDKAKGSTVTSGTETIDLPETDILAEVTIQARSLGDISDNTITPMDVIIKKIELLVDGSTVVKSLTGEQIKALEWYNNGPFGVSDDYWGEDNNNVRYHNFVLYLGRFAGDTKCGLDLGKYSNPQLKITWDASIEDHDGVTYDAYGTPTFTYSVICKMFDGIPAGFLNKFVQSREIDTWDITASATHTTEIPRGFDLWGLMWRGAYKDINPEYILETLRLDFDNGKWVPLDMDYAQLWQVFKTWYPEPCEANFYMRTAHAFDLNPRVLKIVTATSIPANATAVSSYLTSSRRNIQESSVITATTAGDSTEQGVFWNISGFGPMQTIYIPMNQLTDGAVEVVPTTEYSRIDLKTTTGSSSGESGSEHMVAEYLKPNGM